MHGRLGVMGIVGIVGCAGHGYPDAPVEDSAGIVIDDEDDGDDDDDDDDGPDEIEGTVSGTIEVQLYTTGEDGEREEVSWEDGTGGEYVYGKIFVAAYYEGEQGELRYVGQTVIDEPTTEENPYEIELRGDTGAQDIYIYAVLDYYQDNIVGTNEPRGVYPKSIPFEDGTDFDEADITILTGLYGGGSGGSCDSSGVSGDIDITVSWADGDVYSMLLTTSGEGPYHSSVDTPESNGGGAAGDYSMSSCRYGEMNLVGCWDSNGNGMADPLDRWGVYVEEEEDANPVDIGNSDLSGKTIQIPFGDSMPLGLVPFVRLSGTVSVSGGSFDDLDAGSTLYITPLKYAPDGEFEIDTFEDAYDSTIIEWPDLTGESEVPFTVSVPANTVVYLWAFADGDGDGTVNESGDFVAAAGEGGHGKVATGTTSSDGVELILAPFSSDN